MKFKIYGVSRESGNDVEIVLEGDTKEAAEKTAYELNILVYVQKTQEVRDVIESARTHRDEEVNRVVSMLQEEDKQYTNDSDHSDRNDEKKQFNESRFEGPPINCRWCGGELKKERKATGNGMGCLLIIVGLILLCVMCIFPFNLLGFLVIFWGLYIGSKADGYWRCRKCGELFPRKIDWYELG